MESVKEATYASFLTEILAMNVALSRARLNMHLLCHMDNT